MFYITSFFVVCGCGPMINLAINLIIFAACIMCRCVWVSMKLWVVA